VTASKNSPSWARLYRIARDLIHQVNSSGSVIDRWTLGGGTAMMLLIDHRESHDVDIFLEDPQLLAYLDPQKQDFKLEVQASDYRGDGVGSLKLVFKDIGEIDFIVDQPRTANPTIQTDVEGEPALLETIPEIIAKKIIHRGSSITPRDIFDIAAAGEEHTAAIVEALRPYKDDVVTTIAAIARLNPEFVNRAISQLIIKDKFLPLAKNALQRTKHILQAV
jgi:hypothetical protein